MDEFQERQRELSRITALIGRSAEMIEEATRAVTSLIAAQESLAAQSCGPVAALRDHRDAHRADEVPEDERTLLRQIAVEIFAGRRLREDHFARSMFGEPAWDMLLALYICDWAGARFTIGSLAEHLHIPSSSAARWLAYLEREQLTIRDEHPTDRRTTFLAISDKGRQLIDDYFRDLGRMTPDG